jgi:tRNA threonylcarbamoyladenosine biosynthesis protein TsaB
MGDFEKKTLCLSVETSGRKGSVALGKNARIIAETSFSGQMRHSCELFTSVQSLLNSKGKKAKEIGQIFISVGPGSFTGLRIGVTMAKMMSFANDTLISGVNTMDLLAVNATEFMEFNDCKISRIGTILDAKRKQFYISVFDRIEGKWVKILPDCLMTSSEFTEKFGQDDKPIWLLGEGLVYYAEQFHKESINIMEEKYWYPSAKKLYFIGRKLAQAGKFANSDALKPFYLREPGAVEKLSQKSCWGK